MHRIAQTVCRTAFAVAASLLVFAAPLAAKTYEHTYDTGPGGRLEVDQQEEEPVAAAVSAARRIGQRLDRQGSAGPWPGDRPALRRRHAGAALRPAGMHHTQRRSS